MIWNPCIQAGHFFLIAIHLSLLLYYAESSNDSINSSNYTGNQTLSLPPTKQKFHFKRESSNNVTSHNQISNFTTTTSNLLRSRLKKPGLMLSLSLRPRDPKEILKMTQLVPKKGPQSQMNTKDFDELGDFMTSTLNDLTHASFSLNKKSTRPKMKYNSFDRLTRRNQPQPQKTAETSTNYTYVMYGMKNNESVTTATPELFINSTSTPIGRPVGGHLAHSFEPFEMLSADNVVVFESEETRFVTAEQIGGNRPTERPFHFTTTLPPPTTTTLRPKTRAPLVKNRYTKPYSPHNQFYAPTQSPLNIAHNEEDLSVEDFRDFRAAHSAFGSKVGAVPNQVQDTPPSQEPEPRIRTKPEPPITPTQRTVNTPIVPIVIKRSRKIPVTSPSPPPPTPINSVSAQINQNDPDNLPFYKEPGGIFEQNNKYSDDNDNESNDVIGSQHVAPRGPGIKYAPRTESSPIPQPQTTASYSAQPEPGHGPPYHERNSYNPAPVPQQPIFLAPVPAYQNENLPSSGPVYNSLYQPPPPIPQPRPSNHHHYHPQPHNRQPYPNPPVPRKSNSPYNSNNEFGSPPPPHDPASDYFYGDPRPPSPKPPKVVKKSKKSFNKKNKKPSKSDSEEEESEDEESEDEEEPPPPKRPSSKSKRRDREPSYREREPEPKYTNPPRPVPPRSNSNDKEQREGNDFEYGRDVDSEFDKHYRDSHYTPPAISPLSRPRHPGPGPDYHQPIDDYTSPRRENIVNADYGDPNAHNIYKGRFPGSSPSLRDSSRRETDVPSYRNPSPNLNHRNTDYPPRPHRGPDHESNSNRPARIGYYEDDVGSNSEYRDNDRPPLDPIYTRTIKQYDDELIRAHSPSPSSRNPPPNQQQSNYRNPNPIPNFEKQFPALGQYKDPEDYAAIGERGNQEEDRRERNSKPRNSYRKNEEREDDSEDDRNERRPPPRTQHRNRESGEHEDEEEDEERQRPRKQNEDEEEEEEEESDDGKEEEEEEPERKNEKSEDDEEEEEEEKEDDQEEEGSKTKGRKKPPPKKPQQEKSGDLDEDIAGIENEFGSFFAPTSSTGLNQNQGLGQPHPSFV